MKFAPPVKPSLTTAIATETPLSPPLFPTMQTASTTPSGFAVYAYSFWRDGSGSMNLAGGGQYGGSQSGLIATWDVGSAFRSLSGKRVSLVVRLSTAHDDRRDREAALGARWQPLASLPVTLSAEQRFRPHGPDRAAVYVAGGFDHVALPAGFELDTYGQTGWASGESGGYFFDGSAHALHRAVAGKTATVAAGGGVWTGGQRGAQRLDIGPSLRSDVKIGKVPLAIAADWRFRIAGNANPGNGPALTLSTAF